jgi:hypothetical protein
MYQFTAACALTWTWLIVLPMIAPASDDTPREKKPSAKPTRPASPPARKTPDQWVDEAFAAGRIWSGEQLLVSARRGRETSDAVLTITSRDGNRFTGTLATRGGKDVLELTGQLLKGGGFEWTYTKIAKGHGSARNIVGDVRVIGRAVSPEVLVAEFRWPVFGNSPRDQYVKAGTLRFENKPE